MEINRRLNEAGPAVTTIDENLLLIYGFYRLRIRATDSAGVTLESHSRLFAANLTGWDMILGWLWLKELNLDID